MRIFVWHGYLLSGTGSNEYSRALALTLSGLGHEVTVFCQDPHADRFDLGGARVIRPELPGPLPVFVLDRYEDADARLLPDLDQVTLDAFVAANAGAIADAGPADLLISNHVLLGGPVGAASGLPFVVKAHGSELEYAMRGNDRLCRWAGESLQDARAVVAGSHHVEAVIRDLVSPAPARIEVIPPGVDTDEMAPQDRQPALVALLDQCAQDPPNPDRRNERLPDEGNASRLAEFLATERPTAVYVGKLSEEKGVPLLLGAAADLGLRTVVVGFGPLRDDLQADAGPDVLFTGPLQHRHLRHLWPIMDVSVVPSVFPEAFGMVAAEAASCGCPPLVADQTGLAEIAAGLRGCYPPDLVDLASFRPGDRQDLADHLTRIVALPPERRADLSRAARQAAVTLWSWHSAAERLAAL